MGRLQAWLAACRQRPMAHINLPNAITLTRIFLVPLLVVVLLTRFEAPIVLGVPRDVLGAAIFAVASLTDWLDGFVARRRKQVTTLGQMLDPLADKLLTAAAFISLVQMGLAPAWMVAVIIGREIAVTGLRSLVYARGGSLVASSLGKTKMMAQVIAILALILGRNNSHLFVAGQVALWVVLVTAVVSAVDYYRRFTRALAAPPSGQAARSLEGLKS